jgi:hypothetical protein
VETSEPLAQISVPAQHGAQSEIAGELPMIRKLATGEYRLYARKVDPKTGRRRNLGTFASKEQAQQHEREIQYFKRHQH